MNLANRTVLVTGATGGIGRAIAKVLHARGAQLVVTGRDHAQLATLESELGARAIACDLADREAVERLIAQTVETVDVLVANAALPGTTHALELTSEEIDRTLDVNLRAPIRLATALAPAMARRGGGHVVLMSSLSGKTASPRSALYCATKFGLRGFGQAARGDLRTAGVGVTVVFPGFVREAGMFVDSGAQLPPGVGTVSPQQCADAVIRGIERDRGEIDVAPLMLKVGTALASLLPGPAARIQRLAGAERIADQMAGAARSKT